MTERTSAMADFMWRARMRREPYGNLPGELAPRDLARDDDRAAGRLGTAGVPVRLKLQYTERTAMKIWLAAVGRADTLHDRLQHVRHAGPVLGRGQDHLLARDGQRLLE